MKSDGNFTAQNEVESVMPIIALLAAVLPQTPTWSQAQLRNLALERGEFDIRMVTRKKIERYERIGAWFANYHNEAYYPIGVSSRRYIFSDPENILIAQSRHGNDTKTDWVLKLRRTDKATPPASMHGTLRRYLWLNCFQAKNGPLTDAQRASLDTVKEFASYYEDAMIASMECGFIHKDGTKSVADHYAPSPKGQVPPLFPIVADEMSSLGAGKERWHGPGKYKIWRTGEDVPV